MGMTILLKMVSLNFQMPTTFTPNALISRMNCVNLPKSFRFYKFFRNFATKSREVTPSRKKRNKFLCFVLDFL